MRVRSILALALLLGPAVREGRAQSCPAIELEPIVSGGFTSPVFVTHAGDGTGRLFIVERPGAVKVLQPGSHAPTLFLRIARVLSGGERGLLGLAFHPGFETNRRFFVNYTKWPDGATVVAEYRASAANPNVADPTADTATETVLLTFPQPFPNHNGGSLAFGPDGYLYIASGDGGGANDTGNNAQNVNTLLGKILRIDVDTANGVIPYSSPPDNPYAGATPGLDEIFAIGLRNPWRMSFDSVTGQLLVGDVGQGDREEVNLVTVGGNYGWRVMEGTRCNIAGDALPCDSPAFTPPALEHTHGDGRCSITGGYVYRGSAGTLPDGTYLYGDFCSGQIYHTDVAGLPLNPADLPTTPSLLLDARPLQLSSFGEDEDGELYAVDLAGQVMRILPAVRISPLSAVFDAPGGDGVVRVSSPEGCLLTAVSNDPWITITAGESGQGSGEVRYTVGPNLDVVPRIGSLTIGGQPFQVEQSGDSIPWIEIDDVVVAEGPGVRAAFTVRLSSVTAHTVTVQYSTENRSATADDFTPAPLTDLVFDPGETEKPILIDIEDDLLDEDDEFFLVNLSLASWGMFIDSRGFASITDDDPEPRLSIGDKSFAERNGLRPVLFPVSLSERSGRTVSVDYLVRPGSLTPGSEFREKAGTLTFAPGATRRWILVWTRGDRVDEGDETFFITLEGGVNATIATPTATATVLDDDPPAPPGIVP